MYHLLAYDDQKAARREYRLRLITVGLFLMLGVLCISFAALLPSLFLTQSEKSSLDAEEARIAAQGDAALEKSLSDEVALGKQEIAMLKPDAKPMIFDALHGALAAKPSGISVSGFYFSPSDPGHVRLTGMAQSREALVDYQKRLVASGLFSDVQVPLSDFAGSSDLSFSVTLSGNF